MMEIKSWCLALLILNCCEAQSSKCWLYTQQYWVISCTWYLDKVTPDWRSTCAWYVVRPDMTTTIFPVSTFIRSYRIRGDPYLYYIWGCTMTTPFPETDGEYIYYFQDVYQRNIEANRLEIRSPAQPTTHSCPQSILEGIRLICNCTTPYSGNPPGILSWPGYTNTSQLIVDQVRRGSQFTCQLQWNGLFANVTYSPQVIQKSAFPMAAIIGCGCGVVLILTGVVVISVVIITKRKERTNNLYGMDKENNGTIRSPDLSNQNENTNQDPTLQYLTAEGAVYSVIKKPSERRQTENGKYSDKNDIRSSATGNINNEEHSVPHHIAVIPSNLGQNFENDVYAVPQKKLKLVAKVKPNLKPKPPSFSYTPSEGTNVHAEELSLHAEGPCVGALEIPSETDYYNICQQSVSVKHSYDNVELRPAETNSSNITEVTQNDGVQEVTWQGDALQVMRNDGVQEVTQQDNAQQVKKNNDGDEYDVLRLSHNAHEMQFPDPLYNHI